MQRRYCVLAAVISSALFLTAAKARAAEPACRLSVVTDRPAAMYAVGEKVKFLVTLKQGGQTASAGKISYTIDKDGMPPVSRGTLAAGSAPLVIETTLPEPGVLRCTVVYRADAKQQPLTSVAGAAFSPERIGPSLPVPDDFDAFWAAQKAKLAGVPMKPVLTPVKSPSPAVECFDVQIPCLGPRPVSGYFARPVGAAPKSLPAILHVHGAGVRSANLYAAVGGANAKYLSMDINAHGIPNGKPLA